MSTNIFENSAEIKLSIYLTYKIKLKFKMNS